MISGICPACSTSFTTDRPYKKYCSEKCRQRNYVKHNKEKVKEAQEKYSSKPGSIEKRKQVSRKNRENNREKYLLASAKNRSLKHKIPFNLEVSDIVIPENCPILGIKLTMNSGKPGGKQNSISLDRIKPELGYVKGNIQVISFQANMMKSNATPEQLVLFSKWILKTYDNTFIHT